MFGKALGLSPIVLLIVPLAFAACGDSSNSNKSVSYGGTSFADHGTKNARGKSQLVLEADSFYFSPTFVRDDPGQELTLEIENESKDQHKFTVAEQQINTDIAAKSKASVKLMVPRSGVVRCFCRFHTGQGMNGELLAGDAPPQAAP